MQPQKPHLISDYAKKCLTALMDTPLAGKISLGGAFGLMHYFEYRNTYDVDAWWEPDVTHAEQEQIIQLLNQTLHPFGRVTTRSWGDVVSIELYEDDHKAFSFQIAYRSSQLEQSLPSPWAGVKVDSFADLVASKMVALVERGAPRDFLDIYTLCHNNIVTAEECWQLWRQRQKQSGSNSDSARAKLALQTHLARIEQHRPINSISEPAAKESAQQVRHWFKANFIEVLNG